MGLCMWDKIHFFVIILFSLLLIIAVTMTAFVFSAWLSKHSSCKLLEMTLCLLRVDSVCLCGTSVKEVVGIFVISDNSALRSSCL